MRLLFIPILVAMAPLAASAQVLDARIAADIFDQATTACERDAGALWGKSLCGPVMLVDPATRQFVSNRQSLGRLLAPSGGLYFGKLDDDATVANTAIDFDGERWTQVIFDAARSGGKQLLLHEMHHRLQPELGLAVGERDNAHLDTLDGRYLLRLEFRALKAALAATDRQQLSALRDALAIRRERQRRFSGAAAAETVLERNEGLAEYTGVRLGHDSDAARVDAAIGNLDRFDQSPSLVRSFAYATGVAYGLLLDHHVPDWRTKVARAGFAELGSLALANDEGEGSLDAIAARYGGQALRAAESSRAAKREALVARYRAALVQPPTLSLPNAAMNFSFDPNAVVPLPGAGNVYPTLHAKADWGAIEINDGGLIGTDWSTLVVSAPQAMDAKGARGNGWTLTLAPGWGIERQASGFVVKKLVDETVEQSGT